MGYLRMMGDAFETFETSDGALIYKMVGNIARPRDEQTLVVFQTLQYQLDRVAQAKGVKKIAVDGDIGPLTVALERATTNMGDGKAETVAALADDIAKKANELANAAGVPREIPTPKIQKTPSYIGPSGKDVVGGKIPGMQESASIFDAFNNLSTTEKMLAVGAVGAVAFIAFYPRKKKGG